MTLQIDYAEQFFCMPKYMQIDLSVTFISWNSLLAIKLLEAFLINCGTSIFGKLFWIHYPQMEISSKILLSLMYRRKKIFTATFMYNHIYTIYK